MIWGLSANLAAERASGEHLHRNCDIATHRFASSLSSVFPHVHLGALWKAKSWVEQLRGAHEDRHIGRRALGCAGSRGMRAERPEPEVKHPLAVSNLEA